MVGIATAGFGIGASRFFHGGHWSSPASSLRASGRDLECKSNAARLASFCGKIRRDAVGAIPSCNLWRRNAWFAENVALLAYFLTPRMRKRPCEGARARERGSPHEA